MNPPSALDLEAKAYTRALICWFLFIGLSSLAAYFAIGMSGPEFKDFAHIELIGRLIPYEPLATFFIKHYDKFVHASGAFVLSLLACGCSARAWQGRYTLLPSALSFAFIFGFSYLIEALQHTSGRPFTWADIWAACAGSLIALMLVWAFLSWQNAPRSSNQPNA